MTTPAPAAQTQTPAPAAAGGAAPPAASAPAAATPDQKQVVTPPPAQTPAPASNNQASKPDYLDEAYWDKTTNTVKTDALTNDIKTLSELKTFKAEYDIRQQGVPAEAKDYKLSLEGWTPPEGVDVEVSIDESHPLVGPAKEFSKKWALPQEAFADLAKLQATHVATEAAAVQKQMAAQKAMLGEKAEQRISAVENALVGRLGADAAKALSGVLVSAQIVQSFEALLRTTGAPGPTAQNGNGQAKPDLTGMSIGQKFAMQLAASSPQRASNGR